MSIAFSSFAAQLDNEETEEYLISTKGIGMKPGEKAQRASRMSMLLLDELEGTEAVSVTMPLVFAVIVELGLGPIPSLVVAEMFDGKYVTAAMSVCSQLNWTCNFVVGLLFPYMNKTLGPYSFGPFAIVLLLTFVYAWIWLPETAGTTPAELQAALIKRNENVTYHNMDIEGLASESPGDDAWTEALKSFEQEEETK